jgi:mannose-6-phosphate isomerase-like protein (cupin superfamily)
MNLEATPRVIEHEGQTLAIIVPSHVSASGIRFFTPDHFSQQLAYMTHPAGHVIGAHVHREIERQIFYTQEVLIIKKGRVRVDFYDKERTNVESCELVSGDVIVLVSGGHGFEMLEETEMIEVKQGPYTGDADKIRFDPKG